MEYVTSFRDSALKATDSFRGIERTDSQDSSALDEITEGCPQLSYRQVSVGLLILGEEGAVAAVAATPPQTPRVFVP